MCFKVRGTRSIENISHSALAACYRPNNCCVACFFLLIFFPSKKLQKNKWADAVALDFFFKCGFARSALKLMRSIPFIFTPPTAAQKLQYHWKGKRGTRYQESHRLNRWRTWSGVPRML